MQSKSFIFVLGLILVFTTANLAFADLFDYGVNQPTVTYTSNRVGNYLPRYNPYYQRPYCPYNYVPPTILNSNANTATTTSTTDNDGTRKIITTTPIYNNPYSNPYYNQYGGWGRRYYRPYYYPNNTSSSIGGNLLRSLIGFN